MADTTTTEVFAGGGGALWPLSDRPFSFYVMRVEVSLQLAETMVHNTILIMTHASVSSLLRHSTSYPAICVGHRFYAYTTSYYDYNPR